MIIHDPSEIERRSFEIISSELKTALPPENELVVKRVIHTTADFDYAENLVFSKKAVSEALAVLRRGCGIVTDTQMASAGINKAAAGKLGCSIYCFMGDPGVARGADARLDARRRLDGACGGTFTAAYFCRGQRADRAAFAL